MAIVPAAARINELLSIYTLASTPIGQFAETSAVSWGADGTLAHKLEAGAVTASLTATGALTIDVLNDKDDKDRENIVGKAAKDARDGIDWAPQIEPDDKARLAYHINLALKAGLTGKLAAAAKFSVSAERAFILSAYRVHDAQQTFIDAVQADLVSLPSILSLDDCLGLQIGEALAMRVDGSAALSVSVSLAEVFASSVGSLTTALGTDQVLALNFEAGLKLEGKIGFEDELQLAISRHDGGFRAALRKASSRSVGVGLGIGITVEFSKASQNALTGLADQLLDQLFERATEILGELQRLQPGTLIDQAMAQVPAVLKPFAEQLLQKLALPRSKPVGEWIKTLEARRQELSEKFTALAKAQLKASFSFNYQRVATEGTILECDFSALEADLHKYLLAYDFHSILTQLDKWNGKLQRYLHQETYERVSTIGFSLGLGKWFTAKSKLTDRLFVVRQSNAAKQLKISTLGELHYTGEFQGNTRAWKAVLKADMQRFQSESPSMRDFALGMSIAYEVKEKNWSTDELSKLFDVAEVFGVFDASGKVIAAEKARGLELSNAKATVHLSVSGEMLSQALVTLSKQSAKQWGEALAASMSNYRVNGDAVVPQRENLESRLRYYSPGWTQLTRDQPSIASGFWRQSLRQAGMSQTDYRREAPAQVASIGSLNPASATRMAYNTSSLPERFSNYAEALKILTTASEGGAEAALVAAQRKLMLDKSVFEYALTTRAIAYLLSRACERNDSPDAAQYQATLTVQLAGDGPAVVLAQR